MTRASWHRTLRRSVRRARAALAGPPPGGLAARWAANPARTIIGRDNRLDRVKLGGRGGGSAELRIGDQCDLEGFWLIHDEQAVIRIGSRCELNGGCHIDVVESLEIGDDVLIAAHVFVTDHDSHSIDWEQRRNDHLARREGRRDWSVVPRAPVRIDDKVWVGRRAMIMKGVTLGEGSIVAAASVVTKSVAPWTLVAGVPAEKVRDLEPPSAAAPAG